MNYFCPMRILIFFGAVLLLASCDPGPANPQRYLHLAHIRTLDTLQQGVDPRIEQLDLSQYEMILLGGDLTEESSKERSTLEYLDKLFHLRSTGTLWTLGNHDNANTNWVTGFYGSPDYVYLSSGWHHLGGFVYPGRKGLDLYDHRRSTGNAAVGYGYDPGVQSPGGDDA
jgi:hypothetical protein